MTKQARIVVIDSRNPQRGSELARVFEAIGCYVSHWHFQGGRDGRPAFSAPPPKDCLVCLWHINDRDEHWPSVNVTGVTVYYSGGGFNCPDEGEGICPAIRGAQDVETVLGSSFAPLLIEYARAKENGESRQKPWFMEPPTVQHHLMALSVLCQGYLVAHAPSKNDVLGTPRDALDRMGWYAFLTSEVGRAFAKQAVGKAELTENPKWWGKVSEDRDLHPALKRVLGESGLHLFTNSISRLARRIDEKKSIAETDLVAQAYIDLANVLTPERQKGVANLRWATRNSCLRHDWLRNRYMNGLGAFVERLGSPEPDVRLLRRFIEKDFEEWSVRLVELRALVNSFAIEMSPASLFADEQPLSRSPDYTWLRGLTDGLWRVRHPVETWARLANEAIEEADRAYEKAGKAYRTLEQKGLVGADSAGRFALLADFQKLSDACERVAQTLRDFPDRVLVT